MKKILLPAIILISILCGCTVPSNNPTAPFEATDEVTEAFTEPSTEPTIVTEPPEETIAPTEPPVSLGIETGAYQEVFYDEIETQYMGYYLFVPENATENMPLVIFLHGDGEVNELHMLEHNAFMTNVQQIYGNDYPFLALSPCTPIETWSELFVPYTLKHLIDNITENYKIDPEHIIITGHSRGAVGVWHMINTYGDYFSAAVPVSCHAWNRFNLENITNVPIKAFCGNIEEFECNYYHQMLYQVSVIQEAGGDAEFILLSGKRHAETPGEAYTQELIEWMLEQ